MKSLKNIRDSRILNAALGIAVLQIMLISLFGIVPKMFSAASTVCAFMAFPFAFVVAVIGYNAVSYFAGRTFPKKNAGTENTNGNTNEQTNQTKETTNNE